MKWLITKILGWLTGGTLDRVLSTIDNKIDNETERDKIKVEVTRIYVNAQSQLLVGRTWWFQLFFVLPLGLWWTAVILDSIFTFSSWSVAALPEPLNTWAGWIMSAVFLVDGTKALIARVKS